MTVLTTESEVFYLGNGATTEFPYSFLIPDEDSIIVYYQSSSDADYEDVTDSCTFSEFNNPLGGTVTYLRSGSPIVVGTRLSIVRRVPNIQEITVSNQTRYDASVAMGVWDRLTMQIQDLVEAQKRSPRFPFGSDLDGVLIEELADGQALIWDETQNKLTAGPTAANIASAEGYADSASASATSAAASASEAAAAAALAGAQTTFFLNIGAVKANTTLTYTPALPGSVVAGDFVQTLAEGYAYEVLASGAVSQDIITAGGVKLNVRMQSGRVNLRAFDVDATGATDVQAKFQRAADRAAIGGTVIVPTGTYRLNSTVTLSSNVAVVGERDATIEIGANGAVLFDAVGESLVSIRDLKFRNTAGHATGRAINFSGCNQCEAVGNEIRDMPSSDNGTIRLITSTKCIVENNTFSNTVGNAICVIGTNGDGNFVRGNFMYQVGGFGLFVAGNSSENLIEGNISVSGGLELIGVAVGSNLNIIRGNYALSCGDNGISVTGNYNVITGNICRANDLSGIHLYGSWNNCVGNICTRNGQNSASRAGITIQAAFGGSGQGNLVLGNVIDDDQVTPTQNQGLRILAPSYTQWAPGQSISSGTYRYNGIRIYQATTSGTTGATAPTHASGTASDGGVTWNYVNFVRTAMGLRSNRAAQNVIGISMTSDILDQTDPEQIPLEYTMTPKEFEAGITYKYRSIEASVTLDEFDYIASVRSTSPWTISLPTTTNLREGRTLIIKDETGTANVNTITVSGNGNNIEGTATKTITTSYGQLRLYWADPQWLLW